MVCPSPIGKGRPHRRISPARQRVPRHPSAWLREHTDRARRVGRADPRPFGIEIAPKGDRGATRIFHKHSERYANDLQAAFNREGHLAVDRRCGHLLTGWPSTDSTLIGIHDRAERGPADQHSRTPPESFPIALTGLASGSLRCHTQAPSFNTGPSRIPAATAVRTSDDF